MGSSMPQRQSTDEDETLPSVTIEEERPSSPDVGVGLIRAMRAPQVGVSAHFPLAAAASRQLTRAIAHFGPASRALRVPRAAIALRMGLSLERYEETLLRIAEAGLARIDLGAVRVGPWTGGVSTMSLAFELAEAIDALDGDAHTLLSLLHEHECTPDEAALALGWTLREVTVEHTEILHRLRVALGRAEPS